MNIYILCAIKQDRVQKGEEGLRRKTRKERWEKVENVERLRGKKLSLVLLDIITTLNFSIRTLL